MQLFPLSAIVPPQNATKPKSFVGFLGRQPNFWFCMLFFCGSYFAAIGAEKNRSKNYFSRM
ncbi:hypothetical protein CHX27_09035 [Flavobacterium aurantiibacter]|uniref:Uncharacterized protein n=1 Tax=Flavobacterium aurantiibacter TaxID=2023067 RepID=A0A255ZS17_9FLAO|nr:hypothetical protein CHX27_09035 [Flavobacterium aurantiibacter]